MSLRNLVETQCGEGNPLLSLTQHLTKDKTYKEQTYFPASYKEVSVDELVDDFFDEARNAAATTPQAFRMDVLLQEMQEIERPLPTVGPAIAELASDADTWCKEYMDSPMVHEQTVNPQYDLSFQAESSLHQAQAEETNWVLDAEAQWDRATQLCDKEREDSKWSQEYFIAQADQELAKSANELVESVTDPKFVGTEFMKYMKKLGNEKQTTGEIWQNEFISPPQTFGPEFWAQQFPISKETDRETWRKEFLKNVSHTSDVTRSKTAEWKQEFQSSKIQGSFDDVAIDSSAMTLEQKEQFWDKLQHDWTKAAKDVEGYEHPWLTDFDAEYSEPYKEYTFKKENPLKEHPDPLSEGKKCLEKGDIPSAVLFFEAAAQQSPENSEAWLLLGTTHAENEQDPSAIPALRRGVEIEPSNIKGWMALATSFANESYQNYACYALQEWMRNNKEYSNLILPEKSLPHPNMVASIASREQINEVQNVFLKAANQRPVNKLDSGVQCGLGILFNLTGEYDKAVDCFQSATQSNPQDPQLWNKLGATLANGNRSAEAIDAYRNALELSPGFIRCRYNLGIACMNMGAHREAMEHFLEALNMQEMSRGSIAGKEGPKLAVSDSIWSTVRVCLRSLNEQHLTQFVNNRDLKRLNEEFGSSITS